MKRIQRVLSVFLVMLVICGAVLTAAAEQGGEKNSVTETQERKVAAKKIVISGSRYVAKGKTVKLTATVLPSKASQKVKWKSSNKNVAVVSAKGVVKGKKPGTVKITAISVTNPKVKKSWKMTVTPKPVKKISIKAPMSTLDLSGTKTMKVTAKVTPQSAAKTIEWTSSKPAVAKVDSKGVVTAKAKGTTVITAKASDGSKAKAKITITVINSADPVEPQNPNPHEVYVTARQGNKFTFFMYYPELKDSYALNSRQNDVNTVEFRLGFSVKDANAGYTVETWHDKTGEDPVNLSVTQMRHTLYYVNQAEQSYDPVGTAEFRLKGKNLIWTVTFPGSFDPTGGEITGSFFNLYTEEWASEFWPASKPLL